MQEVNSYKEWLEAAGAEVLAYEEFGSYQGDWFAKVRYGGKTFWISDYYGSCPGCDYLLAFEYELEDCREHDCDGPKEGCEICEKKFQLMIDEAKRRYLCEDMRKTFEEVLKDASENLSWDDDAQKMVDWLREHEYEILRPV